MAKLSRVQQRKARKAYYRRVSKRIDEELKATPSGEAWDDLGGRVQDELVREIVRFSLRAELA